MSTRTTLAKRDANTLSISDADVAKEAPAKRLKTDAAAKEDEDEFDTADQELDDEALLAAAEEAESAASTVASSQPEAAADAAPAAAAPASSPPSSSTIQSTPNSKNASNTNTPRSALRQATLFSSSTNNNSNNSSISTPLPKLQPPSDISADPLWLERQTMSPSWFSLLHSEMQKPYFSSTLKSFLAAEDKAKKTTYPPPALIYSWSRLVPTPQHVRIVVVGQDPYHGPNQACGLSFSVNHGVPIPPSLRNIYKELSTEYPGPNGFKAPKHGCLDGWAKQGVLMLNACLTVSAGQAASHHGKGWEGLTKYVLKKIADEAAGSSGAKAANSNAAANSKIATMFAKVQAKGAAAPKETKDESKNQKEEVQKGEKEGEGETKCKGVVFLVWGAPAAKTLTEAGVTDKSPNVLILKSAHPSPLSAHRGFLGNGHFKKANDWLKSRYGEEGMIDWSKL